jgi:hypothetical protein
MTGNSAPPPISPDLRRTAHHEAGHALAAWSLGRRLHLVSIRPGQAYGGLAIMEAGGGAWVETFDPGTPLTLLQPPQTRDAIERNIMIDLAGPIAAFYSLPASGYYEQDPDEIAAEKAAAGLAALSPRGRELLVVEEAATADRVTDEENALRFAHALSGDCIEAAAHVAWLRAATTRLVLDRWYRVVALADVLLARFVLDGEEATSILENA